MKKYSHLSNSLCSEEDNGQRNVWQESSQGKVFEYPLGCEQNCLDF